MGEVRRASAAAILAVLIWATPSHAQTVLPEPREAAPDAPVVVLPPEPTAPPPAVEDAPVPPPPPSVEYAPVPPPSPSVEYAPVPPPSPSVEYAPVPPPPPAVEDVPTLPRSPAPTPLPPGSATDANRLDSPTMTLKKAGEVIKDLAKGDIKALRRGPLLIHGNYCGLGNKPGVPPVDALDAACMRHDACTPAGGVSDCACNERLRRAASAIAADPSRTSQLRALAEATAASMAVLICK